MWNICVFLFILFCSVLCSMVMCLVFWLLCRFLSMLEMNVVGFFGSGMNFVVLMYFIVL